MAETIELKAAARERIGKGAAREVRRQGRVPAVVYGEKKTPEKISLESRELWQQVKTGTFLSTVFTIDLDGSKTRVIPRDLQLDPVRDFPVHVDFLRLGEGASITVEVPVNFLNEEDSPGLKRGGVLNIVRHAIEVLCPVDAIPERIEADLTGLEIGDSIHISAITLPDGVEPTITDRDFTVATIAGRAAEEEPEVDEDAELLEGEELPEGEEGEAEAGEEAETEE
ncbi:MAG: 50S ribosomal protein L25/general stress protein Ctc [Methyloligellaceae bacterium]